MAYKKTEGSNSMKGAADAYPKASELPDGSVLAEGILQRVYTDQFGKPCWVIQTADGTTVGLNHCKSLEDAMEGVQVGTALQAVKTGTFTLTKGPYKGKIMQLFDVLTDEANSNPVSAPVTSAPVADAETAPIEQDDPGPAIAQSTPTTEGTAPAADAVAGVDRAAMLAKYRAEAK